MRKREMVGKDRRALLMETDGKDADDEDRSLVRTESSGTWWATIGPVIFSNVSCKELLPAYSPC